ncbi:MULTISPECIES: hypothetical protein [Sphingomonas]|uniref:Uncharacterized protein n=1 Tax=Sphingomonas trueperi TaxID=53317 RepID=A0A7X5XW42_9SPHN|nr:MULTISPECIES: hypothetical protein [Sphingomonas]NJB96443.1 hypothetical protein [Sphingomonas trueperi]
MEKLSRRSFLAASLIGAYSGIIMQCALAWSDEPQFKWSEAWAIPLIVAVYGFLALPFVSLGLLLFGVPAARALHAQRDQWWIGLVAGVVGAVAGKLVFYAIDHLLFFGYYRLWEVGRSDLGILYGVPTGLSWWWLQRSRMTALKGGN